MLEPKSAHAQSTFKPDQAGYNEVKPTQTQPERDLNRIIYRVGLD